MTNDSALFVSTDDAVSLNYVRDEYGNWLRGDWQEISSERLEQREDVLISASRLRFIKVDKIVDVMLPLYEGRMVSQFDFSEKIGFPVMGGVLCGKARN